MFRRYYTMHSNDCRNPLQRASYQHFNFLNVIISLTGRKTFEKRSTMISSLCYLFVRNSTNQIGPTKRISSSWSVRWKQYLSGGLPSISNFVAVSRPLSWGPITKQTKQNHERQKNASPVAFLSYAVYVYARANSGRACLVYTRVWIVNCSLATLAITITEQYANTATYTYPTSPSYEDGRKCAARHVDAILYRSRCTYDGG